MNDRGIRMGIVHSAPNPLSGGINGRGRDRMHLTERADCSVRLSGPSPDPVSS
jgi:hypothetical protein